jgi:hypothetical protein
MSAREARQWQYPVEGSAAIAPQQLPLEPIQRQAAQERRALRRAALVRAYARRAAVLFVMVCALMAGVLMLQTRIQENNIELNRLKSDLGGIENENQALQIEIGYADDLGAARDYAAAQSGMGAAQPWQIVAVDLEDSQASR